MDLATFFEEKNLPYRTYEITDKHGQIHILDTDVAIEAILSLPDETKKMVANKLSLLDFHNADCHPFLKHVMTAIIDTTY